MKSKICPRSLGHIQSRNLLEISEMVYCPCCGEKLIVRMCEECGAEMDNTYIYCVKCGHGDSKRVQKKMLDKFEEGWFDTSLPLAEIIPVCGRIIHRKR